MMDPGEEVALGLGWEGQDSARRSPRSARVVVHVIACVKVLRLEGLPCYHEARRAERGQKRQPRQAWGGARVFLILQVMGSP